MRTRVSKVYFAWQHEKEEKWLNSMSAKGFQLVDVGFCSYRFDEGEPGEYIYRLEMLEHEPTHPESAAYIRFMEETGAQHIGSILRWVYFRRKAELGAFDIYSDVQSRLSHFERIRGFMQLLCSLMLVFGSANILNAFFNAHEITRVVTVIYAAMFMLPLIGVINLTRRINELRKEKNLRE